MYNSKASVRTNQFKQNFSVPYAMLLKSVDELSHIPYAVNRTTPEDDSNVKIPLNFDKVFLKSSQSV